jgi:NAD(P)-dependent dehydrogenase (short-subunit alcohol dehydrogenase family)
MAVLTWLITGCSSGFGEELVIQLRAAGDNVIACGRNASSKLTHLADTGAIIRELDVSSPPDQINKIIQECWSIFDGGIDVIVSNAGAVFSGAIEELM